MEKSKATRLEEEGWGKWRSGWEMLAMNCSEACHAGG